MGVRKLAGPISLVDRSAAAINSSSDFTKVTWLPNFGFVVPLDNDHIGVGAIDGVVFSAVNVATGNENFGYSVPKGQLRTVYAGETLYDKVALTQYQQTSGFGNNGVAYGIGTFLDVLDRRLAFSSGLVYSSTTGTFLPESSYAGFNGGSCGIGRNMSEMLVSEVNAGSDLLFRFYSTVTKDWTSEVFHLGIAAINCQFVPELGVLLSFHGDGTSTPFTMNIWSLDVIPYSISSPSLVLGVSSQGNVATYQTQVLGQQGEPCIGELIEWSKTGSGTLLDTQTTTDAEGNAQCRVLHGLTDTADTVVTASLIC